MCIHSTWKGHKRFTLYQLFFIFVFKTLPTLYHQLAHTCHNAWCFCHVKVAIPTENIQMLMCYWEVNVLGKLIHHCYYINHINPIHCFPPLKWVYNVIIFIFSKLSDDSGQILIFFDVSSHTNCWLTGILL